MPSCATRVVWSWTIYAPPSRTSLKPKDDFYLSKYPGPADILLRSKWHAVGEGVNECRNVWERHIPLLASPPRSASAIARSLKKGGVAASLIKFREATETDAAGREAIAR